MGRNILLVLHSYRGLLRFGNWVSGDVDLRFRVRALRDARLPEVAGLIRV